MGIPMGIPVGMGWVWGLKCHPTAALYITNHQRQFSLPAVRGR